MGRGRLSPRDASRVATTTTDSLLCTPRHAADKMASPEVRPDAVLSTAPAAGAAGQCAAPTTCCALVAVHDSAHLVLCGDQRGAVRLWSVPDVTSDYDAPTLVGSAASAVSEATRRQRAQREWHRRAPAISPRLSVARASHPHPDCRALLQHGRRAVLCCAALALEQFVTGGADGSIATWHAADVARARAGFAQPRLTMRGAHRGAVVRCAALGRAPRPDAAEGCRTARRFVSAGEDGMLCAWEASAEHTALQLVRRVDTAAHHPRGISSLCVVDPRGGAAAARARVATGGRGGRICVWSLGGDVEEACEPERVLEDAHRGDVASCAPLPAQLGRAASAGRHLATGGGDGRLRVWDLGSRSLDAEYVATLTVDAAHDSVIMCCAGALLHLPRAEAEGGPS